MSWCNQLSTILSGTEGSLAKIKERLKLPEKSAEGDDLFAVGERINESQLNHPTFPTARQSSTSLSPGVQWAHLAAIQSQLQIQSQTVESLTQRLHDVEKERRSQKCQIQILQEEVNRLRERDRDRHELSQGPGTERRMENWKREVGRELSSLRGHITTAMSLGNLEESFGSKLCREELEHLRSDVSQLRTLLKRQEDDVSVLQAEARETSRQYERSCKTLEELAESYRTHCTQLANTVSQYSRTQEEVRRIRTVVSELKEDGRKRLQQKREQTPGTSPLPLSGGGDVRAEADDSDSEDLSPTPSLDEISSDELSWLDDRDRALHQRPRAHLGRQSRQSDFAVSGSDLDDDDDANSRLLDVLNPDFGSDLSLNDL